MLKNTDEIQVIQPQPGPQTLFQKSVADILFMGGAYGGGKTYSLLLEAIRFFKLEHVNGLIFRREREEFMLPGSIWMEARKLYGDLGLTPNRTRLEYEFAKNSLLKFRGIQNESDVLKMHGSQIDFLFFDEVTEFTEYQFWYMVGRLRSVSGQVKPYCRATCNPHPGWVWKLIEWWIDKKTAYPIKDRIGKLRWILRLNEVAYWFDSKNAAELYIKNNKFSDKIRPLSVTFIPATLNDNQILLKNDPSYYSKLSQLSDAEKERFLYGRWFFAPKGKLFRAEWFLHFVIEPREKEVVLITTDTASSTKTANDYTVFQVWCRFEGKIYLLKQIRGKFTAKEQLMLLTQLIIHSQAKYVSIEKASTGFHLISEIAKKTGVLILEMTRIKDKYLRAHDIQEYVEKGYVYVDPNADYYMDFVSEHTGFAPENKNKTGVHDDQVDCLVDACYHLLVNKVGYNLSDVKLTPRYTYKSDSTRRR